MKVLAFAASNSRQSINRQLVNYACGMIDGADIEFLDINDYEMPLYSIDRENESGIPALAHQFYQKIGTVDGLVIGFAEHNGSYTAAYKNLYDWTSRIDMKVYQDRAMLLLAASPGPGGAGTVLAAAKTSAPHFGGRVLADMSVGSVYQHFDVAAGTFTNPELQEQLQRAVVQFAAG